MRLFIAIEIPGAIKQAIAEIQERLKAGGASANWTRPEGIHLTLKFLGEVGEARVPSIVQALTEAARGTGRLSLSVGSAGAFPNVKIPRVLWLGVTGDVEKLSILQGTVEDAMSGLGFEREDRKFSPHLTLARIKFPRPRDNWQQRIQDIKDVRVGAFDAGAVSLMQSVLRREGAIYTEVGSVEL